MLLDRWLRGAGVNSVGELMAQGGASALFAALQVAYADAPALPPSPRALPLAVALMVRDTGFSLADLLSESKQVHDILEPSLARPKEPTLRQRHGLVIGWLVPQAVFEDADWPTATNPADPAAQLLERRTLAGQWLAEEGVGLIVV